MNVTDLTDSQKALHALGGAMVVGVLSVFLYAAGTEGLENFFSTVSVGVLLAGASAFSGGALGFLFGIPRTLQQDGMSSQPEANSKGADAASPPPRTDYRANTNLEQISDWLTKILVGVGLTQIGEIRGGIASLTAFLGQRLGPQSLNQVFAFALLSYMVVLGFLFGYLWTRLFLAAALRVADEAALGTLKAKIEKTAERAASTERKLEELKSQAERDAAALNLAYRQLNPSEELPQATQDELDRAVALASQPIKVQIFHQALQVREENWEEPDKKPLMERAIPLFKALIKADSSNRYHMTHGQLGFALKDKLEPDWAEAEKELTLAIKIRGSEQEHGWLFYELNRAKCRIMTDPDFVQKRPTEPVTRAAILEDLKAAFSYERTQAIINTDSVIQNWLALNNIDHETLGLHTSQ